MTATEAIDEITSVNKWYYNDHYPATTARDIVKRFRSKSITLRKLHEFLNKFGYVEREGEWIKTKMQTTNYRTK